MFDLQNLNRKAGLHQLIHSNNVGLECSTTEELEFRFEQGNEGLEKQVLNDSEGYLVGNDHLGHQFARQFLKKNVSN